MRKSEIKIIDPKTKETTIYNLDGDERLEIHLYYKIKVIEMERKQNTNAVESAILDSCEFQKSKNIKFNAKTFLKGMAKKCDFRYEKLYSGLQKRRAQKRYAKIYFLKNRGISSV